MQITAALRQRTQADRVALLRRLTERLQNRHDAVDCPPLAHAGMAIFDRIYGGQSLAEALVAASATVARDRMVSSVHCQFLHLGDPALPVDFRVETLHDTRSLSVRSVRAVQAGRIVIAATISFALPGNGFSHQWTMPPTPPPDDLASRDEVLRTIHGEDLPRNAGVPWPLDMRHVDRLPWDDPPGPGTQRIWMRTDEKLPDDPLLHASLFLFASDLTMPESAYGRHPIVWQDLIAGRGFFGASLNHAVWLHAPVRIDEWLLHIQESPCAEAGRGFTTGRFFTRSGKLVASVAQEIFIKPVVTGKRHEAPGT
jgi:acyl-CoA thioesterase-2